MFSRTLVNLIDNAIFPAVLLVSSKILGIVFMSKYLGISYTVEGIKLVFNDSQNYIAINSYSSLLMFVAVIGGLTWVLIKAHVFHDTHVSPTLSSKLNDMNLAEIVHDNKTIFTQSFIWLSYAWLVTLVLGVQAYFGLSYSWVFWVALAVSVVSTALLVVDMEREIQRDVNDLKNGDSVNSVVTLREVKKEIFS